LLERQCFLVEDLVNIGLHAGQEGISDLTLSLRFLVVAVFHIMSIEEPPHISKKVLVDDLELDGLVLERLELELVCVLIELVFRESFFFRRKHFFRPQ
jgi:hypothetical protein